MNTCRKIVCVIGLTLAIAGVAFAQSVAQTTAAKMESCCCYSDSCDMTKKDAMKNHVMSSDKSGGGACCGDSCDMAKKNHVSSTDKAGCCCACCGDMMKKDARKNHASMDKAGCCACCGDSCDMTKKDAMKNHVTSSDKHEC